MNNYIKPESWQPNSWQNLSNKQNLAYPDEAQLNQVLAQLSRLPPLVTPLEINALTTQLGEAAIGQRFLLQGGDCAESFADCNPDIIINKLKILLQMSLILIHGLKKPIIRVGRIAGQYAKPRSAAFETQGGISLPSYRGDLINQIEFNLTARTPNPDLMLQAYKYSAFTLNYIRGLIDGGFADLLHPEYWQLDFMKNVSHHTEYQQILNSVYAALKFLNTDSGSQLISLQPGNFYTSHEALHLPYEQALTKSDSGKYYNLSTHFPWIGMRTAELDTAHVEYIRGIENPVAIKVGPLLTQDSLSHLVEVLNPKNIPGRLTLVHRYGVNKIAECLPAHIDAVRKTGITVLWTCDPMHGNTEITQIGIKTRRFSDILLELEQAFTIHAQMQNYLGGIHFEVTGEDVTECVGGARGLSEDDLKRAYKSLCDPRLNYEQALEMAIFIAQKTL